MIIHKSIQTEIDTMVMRTSNSLMNRFVYNWVIDRKEALPFGRQEMGKELLNQDDPWHIGQKVQITEGPFMGMEGVIYLIDRKEHIVRVKVDFFTRPTPVELPFSSLKQIGKEK